MTKILSETIENISRFFFPQKCLNCKEGKELICENCLKTIHFPLIPKDKNIFVAADYNDPIIKRSIWLLKYQGVKTAAKPLAELMYWRVFVDGNAIRSKFSRGLTLNLQKDESSVKLTQNLLIIPIPLSAKRLRERGFNQAELLAKSLSDKLNQKDSTVSFKVLTNVLCKKFHTDTQVSVKDKRKRLTNIVGSFEIKDPQPVAGQQIILVDDVTTTGATFREAQKVLRSAGAKKIICVAVARG